jgi:hypothetical protein
MAVIYMVFSMETYYPAGGMSDCVGMYHTKPEAEAALASFVEKGGGKYGTVIMGQLDTTTLKYEDIDEDGEDDVT